MSCFVDTKAPNRWKKLTVFSPACVHLSHFSCVRLFVTPWIVVGQAPLSMGFPRQEYWRGLPCLPPGNLPDPGTEPRSPASSASQAVCLLLSPPGKPVCCPQAHKPQTSWNQKVEDAESQPTSPPANQEKVLKLVTPPQPPPSPCLYKPFPESLQGVWVF